MKPSVKSVGLIHDTFVGKALYLLCESSVNSAF